MVFQAVQSVLSLLILIAIGFFVTKKPWFGKAGSDLFSKFTVKVAIPVYMTYNVITTCETKDKLFELFRSLPIPFATILLSLLLGLLLAKVFKVEQKRRGVFINAVTFSNTVIIGFPVISSLFGDEATPDGMIYYMANTILFWTIGVYLLRRDSGENVKLVSWEGVKKIFSPPIIGFLIGMVIVLLNIELPEFIFTPLEMLKQTTTPMAMIFIGSIISNADFKSMKLTKDLALILVVRFIVSPIFMAMICMLLPIDQMMKQVFFVLATMPAMTQLGIMSKESDSDYEFASVVVAVTTTVSMVAIPIYMYIISAFQLF